ncbi:hypothetical protein AB0J80_25850 [Actinoplanes sp. NPDC049548]|uniref:hypothetical protein n=1 Tax=Actinoplanes sp. NPDC049548 TaxID=3155152 RepID=UPI00341DCB93
MPQQPNDDGLVPPIKVLRKRLNGVYSAEGLTGPTRRYVLLVVMLVGLASLPTLAAITAGSNELADGGSTVTDVPFIPPASTGPVQIPPSSAGSGSPSPPVRGQAQKRKTKPSGYAGSRRSGVSSSTSGRTQHEPGGGVGEPDGARPGRPVGWSGRPLRPVEPDESDVGGGVPGSDGGSDGGDGSDAGGGSDGGDGSDAGGDQDSGGGSDAGGGWDTGGGSDDHGDAGGDGGDGWGRDDAPGEHDDGAGWGSDDGPGQGDDGQDDDGQEDDGQDEGEQPGEHDGEQPGEHDGEQPGDDAGGGQGGEHPAGGHGQADGGGANDSDDSDNSDQPDSPPVKPVRPPWCTDRTQCSSRPSHHHRPDWTRHKHCEDASHRAHWSHHRAGRKRTITVHIEPSGRHSRRETVTESRRPGQPPRLKKIISHRWAAPARSDTSRRSAMAERPQNLRPARDAARTHNSHRHQPAVDQQDDTYYAARSYRGSHRAERMHRADDNRTVALQRSSRSGRHHADPDNSNRW